MLDNTTELWMTKYIISEIFSSGGATLYKNPSDQNISYPKVSHSWIYEEDPARLKPACHVCPHPKWKNGQWMMFFPNSLIDEKWDQAVDLYRRGKLTGVQSMKVCLLLYSGPENLKKSRPKKLVKPNKSISRKKRLIYFISRVFLPGLF